MRRRDRRLVLGRGPNSPWGASWGPRETAPTRYAGNGPTLSANRPHVRCVPRPLASRQSVAELNHDGTFGTTGIASRLLPPRQQAGCCRG
jgi:hypothetical protein